MHNITILDDVFLALESELALGLGFVHPAQADEVIIMHHLRPDKAALQVSVDLTRGFLRGGAIVDVHLKLARSSSLAAASR